MPGYSLMAFDAINYLIGVEEDRIINGADKGKGGQKKDRVPWGMGEEEEEEEKAVCREKISRSS